MNAAMFGREVDMLCLLIYRRCILVYLFQIHISFFSEYTLHSNEIQCNYHHVMPQLLFVVICASFGLPLPLFLWLWRDNNNNNVDDGDISCVLIDDIDVMQSCIMQQAYITECSNLDLPLLC